MDLKCGNGAFMDNIEDARRLAHSIVSVANEAGTQTSAILTDMNQVLGHNVGNALEVIEAVEYLKGEKVDARLHQITLELCAELLVNAQLSKDLVSAKNNCKKFWIQEKRLKSLLKWLPLWEARQISANGRSIICPAQPSFARFILKIPDMSRL